MSSYDDDDIYNNDSSYDEVHPQKERSSDTNNDVLYIMGDQFYEDKKTTRSKKLMEVGQMKLCQSSDMGDTFLLKTKTGFEIFPNKVAVANYFIEKDNLINFDETMCGHIVNLKGDQYNAIKMKAK